MTEARLWEKLRRIEALFAGAITEGERVAAGNAREKVLERIRAQQEARPLLYRFSLYDPWERRLLRALLGRYGLKAFRFRRQRFTTLMVRAPQRLMEETIWPQFREISLTLRGYLSNVTDKVIVEFLEPSAMEAEAEGVEPPMPPTRDGWPGAPPAGGAPRPPWPKRPPHWSAGGSCTWGAGGA